MEKFNSYSFDDFLADDDFRRWVREGSDQADPVWPQIPVLFPEKREAFHRSAEVVRELFDVEGLLSEGEIELETRRILSVTDKDKKGRRIPIGWYWWAAAILLIGTVTWFSSPEKDTAPVAYLQLKESESAAEVSETYNDTDFVISKTLPDGSVAQLYPGARLKYFTEGFGNVQNPREKREVYMSGDVFFNVARNKARPFLVYTDRLVTRVVGTSFLVRSSEAGGSVEVKTGKVLVRPFVAKDEAFIALTPNQKATYITNVNQLKKELVSEPEIRSEAGKAISFEFTNTPLQEVFTELEKAYSIPIHYAGKPESCSLNVKMGDEPFYSKLEIVCKTVGVEYRIENGEVTILGEGCR